MKKHLLIGSALLAAMGTYSQSAKPRPTNVKPVNMAARIAERFAASVKSTEYEGKPSTQVSQPSEQQFADNLKPSGTNSFVTSWNPFTGSMNIYSSIIDNSAPLHYNEDLNAVSYVHRKSETYAPSPTPSSPGAATGAMVAMISQNWGGTWDSTCFYTDNTNWGRYPQGAIYNPAGNTCMDQAYIVGCGPVTPVAGGWIGNFFASKQLGTANYNNQASTAPNAIQIQSYAQAGNNKIDFPRYDFSTTDDGKVRTAGIICTNISGTGPAFGYRGTRLMTGSFNSGTFVWTADSIIPPTLINNDGTKEVSSTPYMAWNESGTVGYVVHIGASPNRTLNNVGWQPIVFKTTNSGISWAQVNGIDFNLPNMAPVIDHVLSPNSNTNVTIPLFDTGEGIGVTVDKNDNLHIASLILGTFSPDPDSLGFTFSFNNADGEEYSYRHSPGLRPYLYDFIGSGAPATTWTVVTVDSLSSEGAGATADRGGFNTNPWLEGQDNTKPTSDARIQLSRTADGSYVVFTFAESDTSVTSGPGFKWNELPNVKARMMTVSTQSIHPTKVNITKPSSGLNPNVASRAYFHYASRKCAVSQTIAIGANGPCIALPITVTSNTNRDPMISVTHRYATAALNFGAVPLAEMNLPLKPACSTETITNPGTGIQNQNLDAVNNSVIYPNPAKTSAVVSINLESNSNVIVTVSNMVGQTVSTYSAEAIAGENSMEINVNDLAKGVYMVTVKIDNATSTKKLIVE